MVSRFRRRSFRRTRRRSARPRTALAVAKRALRLAKSSKPEKQYFDKTVSSSAPGTTMVITPLHEITQGDDESNRKGLLVSGRSLSVKMAINKHASALFDYVRIMIVQDKQQVVGTAPTQSMILTGGYLEPMSLATLGRFKTLYNKLIVMDANFPNRIVKIYKRFNVPIRWGSGTGSDIEKNGLYMCIVCAENTNKTVFNWDSRLGFTDA